MKSFQTSIQVAHLPYSKSVLLVVLNYYQFSVIHWQIAKVWDNFLRFPARCTAFRLSVCLVLFSLERSRPTATIGSHCPNHDPSGINISYAVYLLQNCATSHGTQKLNPWHYIVFLQTPTSACQNRITMDTVLWNEPSAAIMIIHRNWHHYVCYNETIVHRQSKNPPPPPNPPTIVSLFLKHFTDYWSFVGIKSPLIISKMDTKQFGIR